MTALGAQELDGLFKVCTCASRIKAVGTDSVLHQATYAGEILYFPTVALSEISTLVFIWHMAPVKWHRTCLSIVGGFIAMWTLIGIIVTAAQCSGARPWDLMSGKCIDIV